MSVKINAKTGQIKSEILIKSSIFLRFMAERIVKISEPKTPRKTGRLRMDVVKQVLGLKGEIRWGKDYAIYQEKKQFTNYTTPGTGPHFAENAVKQGVVETAAVAKAAGLI